ASQITQRGAGPIESDASLELMPLMVRDARDNARWNADVPSHRILDDIPPSLSDGPQRDFAKSGDAELSGDNGVERHIQRVCYRARYCDAAARQPEDE